MAKAHVAAADWREDRLNRILPELQTQFEAALHRGEILELEPGAFQELFADGADAS